MPDIVYVNGKYLPREEAMVSVEDRGFQFADGVYEVTRFHGRRGLRLGAHLERLEKCCKAMRFAGVHTPGEWRDIIDRLIAECDISDDTAEVNVLYQQVTRGACPRAHLFPKEPIQPTSVAYFRKAPFYGSALREAGVALSVQKDERWDKCYIKTVCLLPAIWAKQEAVNAGAFEALLVRDGNVTEGASTNIYCVINGEVHTHSEGPHILSGITRQLVFEAAERAGIKIVQRPVPVNEFLKADEAFVSSTTLEIMPVTRVDENKIGSGQVGPVTKVLAAAVQALISEDLTR